MTGVGDEAQLGQRVGAHRFTAETHQVDDLLPSPHHNHLKGAGQTGKRFCELGKCLFLAELLKFLSPEVIFMFLDHHPSVVSDADNSFLAQTFGFQPKRVESTTLGSQLSSADHALAEAGDDSTMSR
jgi:hypothetical protein